MIPYGLPLIYSTIAYDSHASRSRKLQGGLQQYLNTVECRTTSVTMGIRVGVICSDAIALQPMGSSHLIDILPPTADAVLSPSLGEFLTVCRPHKKIELEPSFKPRFPVAQMGQSLG